MRSIFCCSRYSTTFFSKGKNYIFDVPFIYYALICVGLTTTLDFSHGCLVFVYGICGFTIGFNVGYLVSSLLCWPLTNPLTVIEEGDDGPIGRYWVWGVTTVRLLYEGLGWFGMVLVWYCTLFVWTGGWS
jgi:hypothetical protein